MPLDLRREFEADIAHHSCDYSRIREFPVCLKILRNYPERGIAVDHISIFVNEQRTVGIAVKCNAEYRLVLQHRGLKTFQIQ